MDNIGNIDERGFINNLDRNGYSIEQCILELNGNSIDAGANNIVYIINTKISIIDDGLGMNISGLENMFSMYRENHNNSKSIGISGIGGKNSLKIASQNTNVEIFTLTSTGEYLKCSVPWDVIVETGKYSKMIKRSFMTEDEKTEFFEERKNMHLKIRGTTIRFVYNDNLHNSILNNFMSDEDNEIDSFNWCGIIYGKFNDINFKYKHYQKPTDILDIKKYNYFNCKNNEYYLGKTEYIIEHYRDKKNNDIFLFEEDGKLMHFSCVGAAKFSRNKQEYKGDLIKLTYIGNYKHNIALKFNKDFFDPENPVEPNTTRYNNVYKNTYGKILKTDKIDGETLIVRNNQVISSFYPFEKPAKSSSRADWYNYLLINGVKSELEYEVNSSQNNVQDIVIGIQQNKNQYNDKDKPPKPLKRIIAEQRKYKTDKLIEYFKNILENKILSDNGSEDIISDNNSENIIIDEADDTLENEVGTLENNILNEVETLENNSINEVETLENNNVNEIVNEVETLENNSVNEIVNEVETLENNNVNEVVNELDTLENNTEVITLENNINENDLIIIDFSDNTLLDDIYNIFIKYNQLDVFKIMKHDFKNISNKYS